MPRAKRSSGNESDDSDDGGFLTRFHQLPTIVNAPEEPVRIISVRENTFSSSYVLTSSRTVITVSMIFALLESLLCGLGIYALHEEFESEIRIIAFAVFVTFISGEGFRIYLLSRWWGVSPRSDIEPNRAYGETLRCFRNSSLIMILLICPVCLVIVFFVYGLKEMRSGDGDIPGSLTLFVLVAGFDLILFVPCFAFPTAICSACFWRRVVKRHERGMEYLRQNEAS